MNSFLVSVNQSENINNDDVTSDENIMDYLSTETEQKNDKSDDELRDEHEKKELMILGIDLGTSNSCISVWRNNTCEIIPDEYGNRTIPSYVSYTNISKYIGHEAKKQKELNIENVFYEVKRLIGRTYNEDAVKNCLQFLSYKVIENERGCVSIQSTVRDNKIFTPEEISASILLKLKDMAQKYLKREIKDVVITIPAQFNDSQRQATKDAAEIAGLNCVRMLNEPTAAALAYGIMDRSINKALNTVNDEEDINKGMIIMVYDFGGGTLDVSLVEVFDGLFDVQATAGISQLGGVDFDNRLINYCIVSFSKQYYKDSSWVDTEKISRLSLQKLRTQCESAKKILSTNVSAIVAIEDFHDGKNLFVKITRDMFENLCRDLFLLCLCPVDDVLYECDKTENDIDEVILVGGMTRMPYIRDMLNMKFRSNDKKKSKVNCSINPDEAVSVGAALQGYILANRDDPFSDSVTLMDVSPLSIGVEVIGGVMDVLIKRNTIIPCEKTKLYSTDTDNVESVLIKIFEGERTMTAQNYKIGEFELDKIPKQQRGMPEIEITFAIDINGIVTVTAVEKEVKESKIIIVNTNKNGLKPHQLKALVEEAMEQETFDELNRIKKFSHFEMEDLCSNIISNISNKEYKLTQKDIKIITEDVTQILAWLKEKPYKDRSLEEYETNLHKMKKRYGVLILYGRLEDDKVKHNSEQLDATTVYGKDDDEEEEEMKQEFEKVKKNELCVEGMADSEITEIKEMRNALMELCKNISCIVSSGRMNIENYHKKEILNYIDDVMMWYYSHEKPTKIDYKEKIDYVNSICNEIVEKYDLEGKELFDKSDLSREKDSNSQKLEKLCLTLMTMIDNNQLNGSKGNINLLKNKIKRVLKYIYTKGIYDSSKNDDIENDDHVFQTKCDAYIIEINELCDTIYNNLQSITLHGGPIVILNTPNNNQNKKSVQIVKDDIKINIDKDMHEPDQKRGMTIMQILRLKQNEEIEDAIDKQINGFDDKFDPVDETIDESIDETIDETIDEIIDETIDETINETINR